MSHRRDFPFTYLAESLTHQWFYVPVSAKRLLAVPRWDRMRAETISPTDVSGLLNRVRKLSEHRYQIVIVDQKKNG